MPDDSADSCPPDAENNTAEAPAPRPAPLERSDKSDVGCLILLGVILIGVFLLPVAIWFGGPFVIAAISVFLLALATPFCNPFEKFSPAAKWWGRVITFLILAGLIAAALFYVIGLSDRMVNDEQEFSHAARPGSPAA